MRERTTSSATIGRPADYIIGAIAIAIAAGASAQWENLISTTDAGIAGIPGALWVPNQFNNPVIDPNGRITFRGQIGGTGITTANSRVIYTGAPGAWSVLARDGSSVPGDIPTGYVFNTTTGINGIGSSNNISPDGGVLVSGNINGPGVTTLTDTAAYFISATGVASLLIREGDPFPGGGGSTMSTMMTAGSGQQTNNNGDSMILTTLVGGDVVGTTNNQAVILLGPSGTRAVRRKGAAAPGFSDGTTMTPDSFGLMLNGSGEVEFGGTLVGGTVTTANDKVRVTSVGAPAGSLRVWCREGGPTGTEGVNFKATGGFSNPPRALSSNGKIMCTVSLEGPAVTPTLNDLAVVIEDRGTITFAMRKGDSIPGATDGVFSTPNSTSISMNAHGVIGYQGILMNPDGTSMTANSTYIACRKADGTTLLIARQGNPVPGVAGGTFGSLNGSSSISINDAGSIVFSNTALPTGTGTFVYAWDEVIGLRVIARTGDTNFTGTPCTQLTLIGSTGSNGDGGNTAFTANGWLTLRAGDSVSSIYTLARIMITPPAPPCPADITDDGVVDGLDMSTVLAQWNGTGSGDINSDGVVDATDMSVVLAAWGSCQGFP